MKRFRLLAGLAVALVAAPAAADKVLVLASHTDAMTMMGQTTPAEDTTYEYWFGEDAIRYDMGGTSVVVRMADKVLYTIDHEKKQFSEIALPIDFEKLMGPEMAPMMQQMMQMMSVTSTVTPLGRSGEFAGQDCDYYRIDLSMSMMQNTMETCISKELPVDYSKYKELMTAQSEMLPNQDWMKELLKLEGFPVRSESQMTMMGKTFGSWQELQSIEDRDPAPGFYGPPGGYKKIDFDPMAQMHQGRRR